MNRGKARRNLYEGTLLEIYFKHYRKFHSLSQKQLDTWWLPIAAARLSEWLSLKEENSLLLIVTLFTN